MTPATEARSTDLGPTRLLNVSEVADRLRMDEDRVYRLDIPKVRITSGRVRWRERDLEAFIEDRIEEGVQ